MSQLPLELPFRPALGREDFLIAPCNEDAVAWIDRWPDWPAGRLLLCGPPGSGKSHLVQVWLRECGGRAVPAAALAEAEPPALIGDAPALALDDADALAGERESEERLLRTVNLAAERDLGLLMTARTPPASWPLWLADLRSRLAATTAVSIAAPDDALIAAVLVKHLADRKAPVDPAAIGYLVQRMERSFAAAGRVAAALDRLALAGRRRITVPLAREALSTLDWSESDDDREQQGGER